MSAVDSIEAFLHTSHVALLLPVLQKSPDSRIVHVSSIVHQAARALPWEVVNDPSKDDVFTTVPLPNDCIPTCDSLICFLFAIL